MCLVTPLSLEGYRQARSLVHYSSCMSIHLLIIYFALNIRCIDENMVASSFNTSRSLETDWLNTFRM